MKRLIVLIPAVAVLLGGCKLRELTVCEYRARGIVEPPTKEQATTVKAAPTGLWELLGIVLPTIGQTRRKAMEAGMNYREDRSFTPLKLTFGCEKAKE